MTFIHCGAVAGWSNGIKQADTNRNRLSLYTSMDMGELSLIPLTQEETRFVRGIRWEPWEFINGQRGRYQDRHLKEHSRSSRHLLLRLQRDREPLHQLVEITFSFHNHGIHRPGSDRHWRLRPRDSRKEGFESVTQRSLFSFCGELNYHPVLVCVVVSIYELWEEDPGVQKQTHGELTTIDGCLFLSPLLSWASEQRIHVFDPTDIFDFLQQVTCFVIMKLPLASSVGLVNMLGEAEGSDYLWMWSQQRQHSQDICINRSVGLTWITVQYLKKGSVYSITTPHPPFYLNIKM